MVGMGLVLRQIAFEKDVRFKNRFFLSDKSKSYIDRIVALANEHCSTEFAESEPLYRARIHPAENSEKQVPYMWEYRPKPFTADEMGAPPTHLGTAGRLNPAGIPYLYTATTERTAVSETRPWMGAYLSVAKLRLTRKVRLIDLRLREVELSTKKLSEQTELEQFQAIWQRIICAGFSIPCHPGDNSAYAPFQFLAAAFQHAGADGIAYSSSLDWGGHNVALFKLSLATVGSVALRRVDHVAYTVAEVEPRKRREAEYVEIRKGDD